MAKYSAYEMVLLKDGRMATIVEVYEPGSYDADLGRSPEDWQILYGLTDSVILRPATKGEREREYQASMWALKEQGIVPEQ